MKTHEVINQPPVFDYNLFTSDRTLLTAVKQMGADWHSNALTTYGATACNNLQQAGFDANNHQPVLQTHDRFGNRINQVNFHASYHRIMHDAIAAGMPSLPWNHPQRGAHVARAAMVYMHNQSESGTTCPTTMTFCSVPALKYQRDITDTWLTGVLSACYDPANKPWYDKKGLTIGMAMTEKQGGSDVRANLSTAKPVGHAGAGKPYYLTGHKWFCSAPMSDGFLVLAQTVKGLG